MEQTSVEQLQRIEQSLASFASQKQVLSAQQVELANALSELGKSTGATYRIVGQIMVAAQKDDLVTDLSAQKETVAVRLSALEKQEASLREKAVALQQTLSKERENGQ